MIEKKKKWSNCRIEVLHGGHFACQEQFNIIPTGQNVHSNAKHLHCSWRATWPPCKTSIPGHFIYMCQCALKNEVHKAWFPYDRPDRPSRLKIGPSDRDDHIETQQRRMRRPGRSGRSRSLGSFQVLSGRSGRS